jgi:hypothetical protein
MVTNRIKRAVLAQQKGMSGVLIIVLGLDFGHCQNVDFPVQAAAQPFFLQFQILPEEIKPELGEVSEIPPQPQRRIRAYGPGPMDDLIDPHGSNGNVLGHPVLAELKRLHKIFKYDFARVNIRGHPILNLVPIGVSFGSRKVAYDIFDVNFPDFS